MSGEEESTLTSHFAVVVPRFMGSVSLVFSILTIWVIFKSQQKLSSTYHRIIFGMNVYDILNSISMTLTTLPMPRNNDPWADEFIKAGTRLGTQETCIAQGFLKIFGTLGTYGTSQMLCVYYACSLGFLMRPETISKYVEGVLHVYPLSFALWISIQCLYHNLIYIHHTQPWCSHAHRPLDDSCNSFTTLAEYRVCDLGSRENYDNTLLKVAVFVIFFFATVIVTLSFVSWKVYSEFKLKKSECRDRHNDQDEENYQTVFSAEQQEILHFERRRAVFIQVLAYIAVFIVTLLDDILMTILKLPSSVFLTNLYCVINPLQGFLNSLIFIGVKVHHIRKESDPYLSIRQAFTILFFSASPHIGDGSQGCNSINIEDCGSVMSADTFDVLSSNRHRCITHNIADLPEASAISKGSQMDCKATPTLGPGLSLVKKKEEQLPDEHSTSNSTDFLTTSTTMLGTLSGGTLCDSVPEEKELNSNESYPFSCLADGSSFSSIQLAPEKKRSIKRVGTIGGNSRNSEDSSKIMRLCGDSSNDIPEELSVASSMSNISGGLALHGSEEDLDGFSIEEFSYDSKSNSNSSIALSTSSSKS